MEKYEIVKLIKGILRSDQKRFARKRFGPPRNLVWAKTYRDFFAKACVMSHDDYKVKEHKNDPKGVKGNYALTKVFDKVFGKSFQIKIYDKYTFKIWFKNTFNLDDVSSWDFKNSIINEEGQIRPAFIKQVVDNYLTLLGEQYKKQVYFNKITGLVHLYPY